jgi:hypothetical protein
MLRDTVPEYPLGQFFPFSFKFTPLAFQFDSFGRQQSVSPKFS